MDYTLHRIQSDEEESAESYCTKDLDHKKYFQGKLSRKGFGLLALLKSQNSVGNLLTQGPLFFGKLSCNQIAHLNSEIEKIYIGIWHISNTSRCNHLPATAANPGSFYKPCCLANAESAHASKSRLKALKEVINKITLRKCGGKATVTQAAAAAASVMGPLAQGQMATTATSASNPWLAQGLLPPHWAFTLLAKTQKVPSGKSSTMNKTAWLRLPFMMRKKLWQRWYKSHPAQQKYFMILLPSKFFVYKPFKTHKPKFESGAFQFPPGPVRTLPAVPTPQQMPDVATGMDVTQTVLEPEVIDEQVLIEESVSDPDLLPAPKSTNPILDFIMDNKLLFGLGAAGLLYFLTKPKKKKSNRRRKNSARRRNTAHRHKTNRKKSVSRRRRSNRRRK